MYLVGILGFFFLCFQSQGQLKRGKEKLTNSCPLKERHSGNHKAKMNKVRAGLHVFSSVCFLCEFYVSEACRGENLQREIEELHRGSVLVYL